MLKTSVPKIFSRPLVPAAALALLLFAGVTAPQSAFAKGHAKAQAAAQHGTVAAVDASAGTLTLHNKKDGDKTYSVTSKTRIKVNKAKAALADVLVGMKAAVRSNDGTTALAIHAHDKKAKGAVL